MSCFITPGRSCFHGFALTPVKELSGRKYYLPFVEDFFSPCFFTFFVVLPQRCEWIRAGSLTSQSWKVSKQREGAHHLFRYGPVFNHLEMAAGLWGFNTPVLAVKHLQCSQKIRSRQERGFNALKADPSASNSALAPRVSDFRRNLQSCCTFWMFCSFFQLDTKKMQQSARNIHTGFLFTSLGVIGYLLPPWWPRTGPRSAVGEGNEGWRFINTLTGQGVRVWKCRRWCLPSRERLTPRLRDGSAPKF